MSIALATQTAPHHWWDEPDAVLATALELLGEQAERIERARHG